MGPKHRHKGRRPKINPLMKRLSFFHIIWYLIIIMVSSLIIFTPVLITIAASYRTLAERMAAFWTPPSILAFVIIQSVMLIVFPFYKYILQDVITWSDIGLFRPKPKNAFLWAVLGALAGLGLAFLVMGVEKAIGHESSGGLLAVKLKSATDFAMILIAVSVVGPIGEEFFFRGIAFKGFGKWLKANDPTTGYIPPLVFSTVLFAVVHFYEVFGFLVILLLGLVLGLLTQKSGGLLSPMVAHGMYNGVILVGMFNHWSSG